ncbi:hypothetical protein DPMN_050097 [Dreissena polymorpha]|uniref:Uncharacterized protein n=1 Tax=Dreissena polymorpha TaxID=45954 RepID=A0A9D4CHB9_DREPO|nr:hypothetical protein DPMN_050097 [Dreissena polymorpha]
MATVSHEAYLTEESEIADSGSALDNRAVRSTPNAEPFIIKKGCERAPNQIKCLRDFTTRHFEDDDTSAWQPVIDGYFLIAFQQEIIFGNDTHTCKSGSALDNRAVRSTPNAEPFITKKGCERSPNQIKCLRDFTTRHFEDDDTSAWQPVIDGDFLIAFQQEIIFGNDTHTSAVGTNLSIRCVQSMFKIFIS